MQLSGVAPAQSATGSMATLTLAGSGFTSATAVELVAADKTVYKAASVSLDTLTQLTADFDLKKVPQGVYSVEVSGAGGSSSTLAGAFTVTPAGRGHLDTKLILPTALGRHIPATLYVQYSNTGSQALPAPLLVLYAPPETIAGQTIINLPLLTLNSALLVSGYWTSSLPAGYSHTVEILASGKEVPGWLEPGESVTVPVYYAGMQQPWSFAEKSFEFGLQTYTQHDPTTLNWSSVQASLQPPGVSTAAWNAIFPGLTAALGNTWGGYVAMLDDEAQYLGKLGEDVTDVSRLWQFAINQANGLSPVPVLDRETDLTVPSTALPLDFTRTLQNSIAARNTLGPLGYGWADNWQYALSVASDGTVTVTMPSGAMRIFQPDSRGTDYFAQPGDNGILTQGTGGIYQLQESDGTIESFNPDGTLSTLTDTHGNHIAAGYTSGRLTGLTSSSGGSLTIAYNSAGLIQSVASSDGRTVTYAYDSTDHYLISVAGYGGGTTKYAYITGPSPAIAQRLDHDRIPGRDRRGFHVRLDRPAGRACRRAAESTRLRLRYTGGKVTVTNAAGDASSYSYDDLGNLLKFVDPLGNVTFATYNPAGAIKSLTGPTGLEESFTYDGSGNLVSETNPLGQTTRFTYTGQDNLLASTIDPQGDVTSYQYDASGDLTTIQYPDFSVQTATYDALGDPLSLTQQTGAVSAATYNAAGQVASVTLSDGSQLTYTYNAVGEIATATDPSGKTTLTYNAAGNLTAVSYPNGTSLQYTYSKGQRIRMVAMSGATVIATVNYTYTQSGQLAGLTDGAGKPIISYTYNALGELTKELKGDGTSTTYKYDADGHLVELTNNAAGGAVDSHFQYTYNALGQVATEVTGAGTWAYTYDSLGALTGAIFTSTNPSIPSQNLTYVYNAAGDRIQTIANGATATYTSNSVNEYTTITSPDGTTTDTYNASGDLVSRTDPSGTTTYSYDSLNRLIGITSPAGSLSYQYDALGNVIATTHNGQTTHDLVDPTGLGDVVAQVNASGSLVAGYTYGLGLVSQTTPSATSYYEFDALGAAAGLTTVGASPRTSSLVASYSYLPFGSLLSSTGTAANPFTFAGQTGAQTDASGLSLMGARSYDSTTGQFTTNDPLGIAGGTPNLRLYVGNSPTNALAPTGLGDGSFTNAVDDLGTVASSALAPALTQISAAFGGLGLALNVPGMASVTAQAGAPSGTVVLGGALAGTLSGLETTAHATETSTSHYVVGAGSETAVLPIPTRKRVAPEAKKPHKGGSVTTTGKVSSKAASPGSHALSPAATGGAATASDTAMPASIIVVESGNTQVPGLGGSPGSAGMQGMDGNSGNPGDDGDPGSSGPSGVSGISGIGGSGSTSSSSPSTASTAMGFDPNAKLGPVGYGTQNYVSGSALTLFPYTVDFENSPTATAPAQQVTITDQLDPNFDLGTFQLTEIAFGDTRIAIPPGTQSFNTTVPMTYNGQTFNVVITAGLNYATRQVYARFQSVDPATQLPPDVLTGFLPPEDGTGRGQGFISYIISPKPGLPNGTQIRNVAVITFDSNSPISTDQVSETDPSQGIDPTKEDLITLVTVPPTASVAPCRPPRARRRSP